VLTHPSRSHRRAQASIRAGLITLTTVVVLALPGTGIYEAQAQGNALVPDQSSAETAGALPSLRWLEQHCPIKVSVNIEAGHDPTDSKKGVSVQAKRIRFVSSPINNFAVKYTWEIGEQDAFCGIRGLGGVGGDSGGVLRPTTETARGGSYIDPYGTPGDNNVTDFIVYARRIGSTSAAATTARLHSVHWLRTHCPIQVPVNVLNGRPVDRKDGISLSGKVQNYTVPDGPNKDEIVLYNWQISSRDIFCGIVGNWASKPFVELDILTLDYS